MGWSWTTGVVFTYENSQRPLTDVRRRDGYKKLVFIVKI